MDLNTYQEKSKRTMPGKGNIRDLTLGEEKDALANYSMGLTGESGEVVDHIKKYLFHGHELDVIYVKKELGDVMHYIAGLATLCGLELNDVAQRNIVKLERRYPEGFSQEASVNRKE